MLDMHVRKTSLTLFSSFRLKSCVFCLSFERLRLDCILCCQSKCVFCMCFSLKFGRAFATAIRSHSAVWVHSAQMNRSLRRPRQRMRSASLRLQDPRTHTLPRAPPGYFCLDAIRCRLAENKSNVNSQSETITTPMNTIENHSENLSYLHENHENHT